jgi:hypothetical protein
MAPQAHGTFDVNPVAEPPYDISDGVSLGRTSFNKQFHGDLEASSRMQALTATSPVQGSMSYVGIERVSGSLHGKTGTFILQHHATMNRGDSSLNVEVVPDTGTDELTGLAGTLTIDIVDGEHRYAIDYTLLA